MISFIVCHFERPLPLLGCVTSLLLQDIAEKEIIITNSSHVPVHDEFIRGFSQMAPADIHVMDTADVPVTDWCCYESANRAAEAAKGEWLCFPSDDSYYVPGFAETMIRAGERFNWDFVYCDFLYDPRWNGGTYEVVRAIPLYRFFEKTAFIVRKEAFLKVGGFPLGEAPGDFRLADALVKAGVSHGKAPGVMVVHN